MKICAATGNPGKLKELRRILEAQGHQVLSQKELGLDLDPEETGTTFAENAAIKAAAFAKASGLPTIADDSGLCVEALGGAPGVYSARYCGHHGDDEANNDKLLEAMRDVPAGQRAAKFVSAVCFRMPDGRTLTCMGECPGQVALDRQPGDYGFGYDPCLSPTSGGFPAGASAQIPSGTATPSSPPTKKMLSATAAAPWRRWKPNWLVFYRNSKRRARQQGGGQQKENTMLTSKQRAILRGKANTMDPVFQIGKGEIDQTLIDAVKACLDARELIKLKVLETSMYNAREASVALAEATGADCVQVIGSKFVLYLQKKKDSAYADLLK